MSYWLALLIFLGSAALAVGGLYLARRWSDFEKLRSAHEVSGYFIAIGGTVYAVLLGLIVVDALSHGQYVRDIIERETNDLADIYVLASNLPEPQKGAIKSLCKSYANQVSDTEWNRMDCGSYCVVAKSMALDIMKELMAVEPKTEREKALYPKLVDEAADFWQSRQERIKEAEKGIPPLEMVVLVVGAVLLIVWTYFFRLEHFSIQATMTAMLAMLISLNFILLFLFAYPFRGEFSIKSNSFKTLQSVFTTTDRTAADEPK